jgi:glucose-6-phosphate 1-dehydrogenase
VTKTREADALVVFGITGDLARKMTFRSLYRLERRGLLTQPVIGVAIDEMTVEQLIERARESITETEGEIDEKAFAAFSKRLNYVQGGFDDDATYERLKLALGDLTFPTFYLEIPPPFFARVVKGSRSATT